MKRLVMLATIYWFSSALADGLVINNQSGDTIEAAIFYRNTDEGEAIKQKIITISPFSQSEGFGANYIYKADVVTLNAPAGVKPLSATASYPQPGHGGGYVVTVAREGYFVNVDRDENDKKYEQFITTQYDIMPVLQIPEDSEQINSIKDQPAHEGFSIEQLMGYFRTNQ